jgi:hypothetical protein
MPAHTLVNCLMLFFYLASSPPVKGRIQHVGSILASRMGFETRVAPRTRAQRYAMMRSNAPHESFL